LCYENETMLLVKAAAIHTSTPIHWVCLWCDCWGFPNLWRWHLFLPIQLNRTPWTAGWEI
jgi:hypothetical protein